MEREFAKMRVWVNGTFDVFHPGHLALLKYAAAKGEVHVGIDSDLRVKELKGHDRPVYTQEQRKEMLESLKFVEKVYIFYTDHDLERIMREVDPTLMVIGSDYEDKKIIGKDIPRGILFFKRIEGISTSEILNHNVEPLINEIKYKDELDEEMNMYENNRDR